jgi:hypothetical protein
MMQRHNLEIDSLHKRPNHPVLRQRGPVRTVQFIFGARSLHDSHAAQENKQVGAGKDGLIAADAGEDFEVLILEDDSVLEEFEPGGCCGAEDSYVR